MEATLIFDAKALLGEGAIWNLEEKKLYWVDIEAGVFNIYDPATQINKAYPVGKRIGTVVSAGVNKALLALEDGIALISLADGTIDYKINTSIHLEGKRFNDGKCDPRGRFWVGSMSVNDVPEAGMLYCMGDDFSLAEKITGVSISNGIVWSADAKTMYYIDTPTRNVVQYDYDIISGNITNQKVIIEIQVEMGYPDGMTIDSDGMLWIALWDGFGVIQCNPFNGKIIQKVSVPVPKVTSCAFGGENLDQLYITTASYEMSLDELKQYPLSGSLFVADVKVKGLPAFHFKL